MTDGWPSLLPPLVAIAVATWKREVIVALLLSILTAELLLAGSAPLNALPATVERLVAVFAASDNSRILLFSLLIGALLGLIRCSGGVSAFVRWLLHSRLARGPRSVSLLTALLGLSLFIESNLSILACGTFAQPLFDRFQLSRARLAFIVDGTCAPVSVLILLNGWGAYVLGLLQGYGLESPVATLLASVPLNFYALTILLMVAYTAWTGRVHGALATHERYRILPPAAEAEPGSGRKRYFVAPLLTLVGGILVCMYLSGNGNLRAGAGASAVLYATCMATLLLWMLLRIDKVQPHAKLVQIAFAGMAELLPVVAILLLAFALGAAMQELGTGAFIARLVSAALPLWLVAPVVFLSACLISFTTGTSWGTFGILVPVVLPVALATGLPPALLLAAVLGGGVFGDHCSPISDSTVLSSLASGCEHLLHVQTQLPYALLAALLSLLLFLAVGLSLPVG